MIIWIWHGMVCKEVWQIKELQEPDDDTVLSHQSRVWRPSSNSSSGFVRWECKVECSVDRPSHSFLRTGYWKHAKAMPQWEIKSIGFTTPCRYLMRYLHSELAIPVSLSWCRCCNLCENGWRGPRLRFRQGIPSKLCATQGEMCPIHEGPQGAPFVVHICAYYIHIYTYYEHWNVSMYIRASLRILFGYAFQHMITYVYMYTYEYVYIRIHTYVESLKLDVCECIWSRATRCNQDRVSNLHPFENNTQEEGMKNIGT